MASELVVIRDALGNFVRTEARPVGETGAVSGHVEQLGRRFGVEPYRMMQSLSALGRAGTEGVTYTGKSTWRLDRGIVERGFDSGGRLNPAPDDPDANWQMNPERAEHRGPQIPPASALTPEQAADVAAELRRRESLPPERWTPIESGGGPGTYIT